MLRKKRGSRKDTVRVTFEYPPTPWSETVCLAGDFNEWRHDSLPLHRSQTDDSPWHITLELPRGREYAYRYVINRITWEIDEQADGQVAAFDGEFNSVVRT